MQQHHTMTVTVSAGGEIKVDVVYRDRVPDLLSGFTAEVQGQARRFLWWPNAYERKLWRAARGMPFWARATIRQHILHERAERIQARMNAREEVRREREQRRQARLSAKREVAEPHPVIEPIPKARPIPALAVQRDPSPTIQPVPVELTIPNQVTPARLPSRLVGGDRHASGSAWQSPVGCQRTLTERLAQDHQTPVAAPWKVLARGRGR